MKRKLLSPASPTNDDDGNLLFSQSIFQMIRGLDLSKSKAFAEDLLEVTKWQIFQRDQIQSIYRRQFRCCWNYDFCLWQSRKHGGKRNKMLVTSFFLAHQSTTYLGWAIVIDDCPASVVCVSIRLKNYLENLLLWNRPTDFNELHRNDRWVMHFQKTSKIWILWRTLVAMATERKNCKNLLVPKSKGWSFHIWHVESSSGPLSKYFKLWSWSGN